MIDSCPGINYCRLSKEKCPGRFDDVYNDLDIQDFELTPVFHSIIHTWKNKNMKADKDLYLQENVIFKQLQETGRKFFVNRWRRLSSKE